MRTNPSAVYGASASKYALRLLGMLACGIVGLLVIQDSMFVGVMFLLAMLVAGVAIHVDEQPFSLRDTWTPGHEAMQYLMYEISVRRRHGEVFAFVYGTPERSMTRRF